MGIVIRHRGSFQNTERFFKKMTRWEIQKILDKYGEQGVVALSAATPMRTGETAGAWNYQIEGSGGKYSITWNNEHVNNGVNIALIIQLGHGTGTGGYVEGIDYINPALEPVFEQLAEEAWQEVKNA